MTVPIVRVVATIKLIKAIIKASFKKIPKTSLLLAPKALRIPISCFLLETDTPMKLINNKEAKTAKIILTIKNTFFKLTID